MQRPSYVPLVTACELELFPELALRDLRAQSRWSAFRHLADSLQAATVQPSS
jgi:hypothetical protein